MRVFAGTAIAKIIIEKIFIQLLVVKTIHDYFIPFVGFRLPSKPPIASCLEPYSSFA
jgi:hypothetical protein